ncbi:MULTISPECIES: F0F1 ATP synthase subunit delta [unclassified Nocardioides]|jgi:F-type H+-transporting ATPase subunit delta|uniref:F0F1 ATP synthase subunit delta n=1 Tax=Nocardioides sp. URHA0032 TaxID=1380388 RepID=UPI0006888A8C|nr:F0F1 ATP synthase subunit delta [Nocardioides sp. URHA0032]
MDLRGASADSLRELSTELDSALRAGSHADQVAGELFTVAQLLRDEPALRRVASDASLPAEPKQGLVTQVLDGKVDALTLGVVVKAAGLRWTSSRDLADALERLGELTVVMSVGSDADKLADEIFALSGMVTGHPELRDALSNPARDRADKEALLDDVLGGKVLPATLALAKQSLAGTYRTVTAALENYRKVAADAKGEYVATVRVVAPLSDDDRKRLTRALGQQYGREIHVNEIVDPTVLGGIRVEIGDDVIDGTVSSRLDDARRKLVG